MHSGYDFSSEWEKLARPGGKIVYLVLDGGGGIPHPDRGASALQLANTPNLDRVAKNASTGLLEPVGPGITPGSGPGHLALFGYDPLHYRLGRGVLSALGIDFPLREGDVAARVNFALLNSDGIVKDRRAGRLPTEENRRLSETIRQSVRLDFEGEFFFETVSEHRALLVLRGEGLGGEVNDTDPQETGRAARAAEGEDEPSRKTAALVRDFLHQAERVLQEEKANGLLLRGFEKFSPIPTLQERFGLRGLCLAGYPMYRGLARLLGMEVGPRPGGMEEMIRLHEQNFREDYDLVFLHVKGTDKKGEDGDIDGKVRELEKLDPLLPHLLDLDPAVLVITSDHSTPAAMAAHSWHPVPVLLYGRDARVDPVDKFDELSCRLGVLGLRPGLHLMGLALAHAGRLRKFGA